MPQSKTTRTHTTRLCPCPADDAVINGQGSRCGRMVFSALPSSPLTHHSTLFWPTPLSLISPFVCLAPYRLIALKDRQKVLLRLSVPAACGGGGYWQHCSAHCCHCCSSGRPAGRHWRRRTARRPSWDICISDPKWIAHDLWCMHAKCSAES
jgi:hypothetical protein